jgi:hypothetical protein
MKILETPKQGDATKTDTSMMRRLRDYRINASRADAYLLKSTSPV